MVVERFQKVRVLRITKYLCSVANCMQIVKFIFNEMGVQFSCSLLSFGSFSPHQSNYCTDQKLFLVLKIEDVTLQVVEPCIWK